MSLVVTRLCRDAGMTPPLTGVYAPFNFGVSGATVPEKYEDQFFSKEQHANALVLNAAAIKSLQSKYKPDQTSPLAFPVAFPSHAGLPKAYFQAYFQAYGLDPVRDCSIVLERVYRDDGVPTKMDIYPVPAPATLLSFYSSLGYQALSYVQPQANTLAAQAMARLQVLDSPPPRPLAHRDRSCFKMPVTPDSEGEEGGRAATVLPDSPPVELRIGSGPLWMVR
ncbi:hypothetical protein FZEAL_899 [Fusarium zealandicum]|uniref:Uncharacterized protein n=1 Tax=Fusarium zealandicum TaxID=1053134 RepID=A0A8H4XPV6_9HYPO|nr:hypothetical protein FZEAL_899 [Fusarium zealandicum]